MPVASSAHTTRMKFKRVPDDVFADVILERPIARPVDQELALALARNGLASRALPFVVVAMADARRLLHIHSRRERFRAMGVAGTTSLVQKWFRSHGIEALFYKGAALGAALGEQVGERPSADVDVLVRWGDLPRVHDLLTHNGYSIKVRYLWMPTSIERRLECERTYVSGDGIALDVHWWVDTGLSFRTDFEELWVARREVRLAESDVETLGDLDALLVTAVHGCRELWHSAKWIVDAGRQLNRLNSNDLAQCHDMAHARGCGTALLATEVLISRVGAGPSPNLSEHAIESWVDTIRAEYAGNPVAIGSPAQGRRRNQLRGTVLDSPKASTIRTGMSVARGLWGRTLPPRTQGHRHRSGATHGPELY